ncbi:glycerophosphodiester phosphodiesterase family protein [Companilactobacillus nantensis]|uniref:GP-PDE domain-containing protein n=1 Tax=Companilactobacillus nantensis DSM 16982 TaxID=1423774 RepID=A0A0R1WL84_9LACO|nr:glycerophosphodiester phosphodiesterase family protein [Companilactobacillus nantensis]KRM18640.1 hypothetical protein FD31_GL000122 [Companilactobacillus nantensis DSM 16982]GEO63173.1 hypothetical protein LNA01_03560 [Companilactobacillus nantensis]
MKVNKNKFLEKLHQNKFLIVVHRGSHGGNVIENTSDAVKVSQLQHADMIEIDISMSTDNDFFIFHDGGEERLLNETRNIQELSTAEINSKHFRNALGETITKSVETFDYFYDHINHDVLLNIDRSWDYWDTFLPELDRYEAMREYFILKSPVKREYLEKLNNHSVQYLYFPIVTSVEDLEILADYPNLNIIGFEIIENKPQFTLINAPELDKYRNGDYMFLGNSIKLNDKTDLFGKLDDNLALLSGVDWSWSRILNFGINTIQTDWPDILNDYRNRLN